MGTTQWLPTKNSVLKTNLTEQASASGDGIIATSYSEDGITRGNGFVIEKNFAIASAATLYILFDFTTYVPAAGQLGQVYILPSTFSTSTGPVTVNIYRGTNYTGGTPFSAFNANTLVAKTTSGTTVSSGPTGSDKGSLVLQYLVGGQSQGNQSASGQAAGLAFFIRSNAAKTLLEIVNGAAADITFHYGQVFYEI